MKKVGKIIGCLLPMVAAFATQVVVASVVSAIYSVIIGIQGAAAGFTDETEIYNFIMEKTMNVNYLMVVTAIATFYTLIIGFFWYRGLRPKTDFKLREAVNGKLLLATFLLGVSLQLLISMWLF